MEEKIGQESRNYADRKETSLNPKCWKGVVVGVNIVESIGSSCQ